MSDTCEFEDLDETNDILRLLMRHWNTIATILNKDEVYVPILLKGESGACLGNDWAGKARGDHRADGRRDRGRLPVLSATAAARG